MRKFLLGLLVGLLLAGLTVVIGAFSLVRLTDRTPALPGDATLLYKLEGDVPETAAADVPFPGLIPGQQNEISLLDHHQMLRRAATDSRVRAVLFMPRGVDAGWGKLGELRSALLAFKKSGKPLVAWLRNPGAREYYLATACDQVYFTREDLLNVKGIRAELTYVKRTLDKVGAEFEVEHAGRYKDAGDIFTRTEPSPETRQVMDSLLDNVYGHLIQTVASARKKSPQDVRALFDQGPFLADRAKAAGLVDGLLYEDEVMGLVARRLGQGELKKMALGDYHRASRAARLADGGKKVAVLVGEGGIVRESVSNGFSDEDGISSEGFRKAVQQVANDKDVSAVILRIDSPGGDAIASDEILRELKLLSRKKPMVVSMSDVAASGGYYMAITGDPILAYPNTVTGSIGVIYGKPNLRGTYEKLGLDTTLITRGRYAAIDSLSKPMTPDERTKLAEGVQAVYQSFLQRVAEGRRKPVSQIAPLAEGRVWMGSQARQNGLVDELGGLDRAVELVKQKAKMGKDERVRLVQYPQKRNFFEQVFSQQADARTDPRVRTLLSLFAPFEMRVWLAPGYKAALPYRIEFK